jgi:hypothetical protein
MGNTAGLVLAATAMGKLRNETVLQCPLLPRETLRRGMMVETPMVWKRPKRISRPSKNKADQ